MSVISRSRRPTSWRMTAISPVRLLRVVGAPQRFDGAAQGGQRVPDLVRDIGGKRLDRLHPVLEGGGHLRQRPRKGGDFVVTVAVVGDRDLRADAAAHEIRCCRQSADRPHDGARQVERQQNGNREGDRDEPENGDAGVVHAGFDVAVVSRQHQPAPAPA